ncbi:MAG: oxidoreductase [Planctomycetes bacterium]|nr:oxidoreductase [Planctomycetota bacterium]
MGIVEVVRGITLVGLLASNLGWIPMGFGQQWELMTTGSQSSLRAICALDSTRAWVSGSQGTLLRTVDSGRSWSRLEIPELAEASQGKLELRSLHAWSDQEAIVATAGQPCAIYKTTDGGHSWDRVYSNSNPAAFVDSMRFFDSQNGFVIGDPIDGRWMLLHTGDGGNSWQELSSAALIAKEGEAAFAASNSCLLVDSKGSFWFGTGGSGPFGLVHRGTVSFDENQIEKGTHLTIVTTEVPMMESNASSGLFSLATEPSARMLVAVGGDYQKTGVATGHIAINVKPLAKEQNWRAVTGQTPRGFRSAVVYASKYNRPWICTGPNGSDWSADGLAWEPLSDVGFHALSVANDGTVWASGSEGRVARLK